MTTHTTAPRSLGKASGPPELFPKTSEFVSVAVTPGRVAGTADVDAEQCTALLVITVGGDEFVNDPDADCFNSR